MKRVVSTYWRMVFTNNQCGRLDNSFSIIDSCRILQKLWNKDLSSWQSFITVNILGNQVYRGCKGVSDPGFPKKISAIPSVPIVQNNAFPTSRLKMIIPDSLSFRERALFPKSRKFFSGKMSNHGIPGTPYPPSFCVIAAFCVSATICRPAKDTSEIWRDYV